MIWSGGSKPMKQELPSWHSSIVVWVSWIVIADRRDELWKKHMFCFFFFVATCRNRPQTAQVRISGSAFGSLLFGLVPGQG